LHCYGQLRALVAGNREVLHTQGSRPIRILTRRAGTIVYAVRWVCKFMGVDNAEARKNPSKA
jgi:hypothetical protein